MLPAPLFPPVELLQTISCDPDPWSITCFANISQACLAHVELVCAFLELAVIQYEGSK